MTDEELRRSLAAYENGLKMAREGAFDEVWAKAPPIDGRSQREMFLEAAERAITEITAELARRLNQH